MKEGDPPGLVFIPLAEESGLIVATGEWIISAATRCLGDLGARGLGVG